MLIARLVLEFMMGDIAWQHGKPDAPGVKESSTI
jgi:hypothetical protein